MRRLSSHPFFFSSPTLSLLPSAALAQSALEKIDWNAEYNLSWYLEAINAEEAHRRGFTGKDILVGIVDTGLDGDHREFEGRVSPLSRSHDTTDFSDERLPKGYHGTHVTGILGAARDGRGNVGVAYESTLLMSKIPVDMDESTPADVKSFPLIYAAESGAKVISGSYGTNFLVVPLDEEMTPTLELNDLRIFGESLRHAARVNEDAVFVFAAGNEFEVNASGFGFYPLITPENLRGGVFRVVDGEATTDLFNPNTYVYLPPNDPRIADFDLSELHGRLITVVATDRWGHFSGYSNQCGLAWQWCIAAPGGDELMGVGVDDPEAPENMTEILSTQPGDDYSLGSGTSMATPVVAGGAAVLRQAFPYMTGPQIIELILTTARRIGPEQIYGRGMFDLGRAVKGPAYFGDRYFNPAFDVDTKGHDTVWEGDIEGAGRLVKRGDGMLTMLGDNTYEGGTRVLGGGLTLMGSLGSKLAVGRNAVLRGNGRVDADFAIAGHLSPGASDGAIDTIQVSGLAAFTKTSTYHVDVAGKHHDRLQVGGEAILLGGTLEITFWDGQAPVNAPLPVISAEGGVKGRFKRIKTNSASDFLKPSMSYVKGAHLSFQRNDRRFLDLAGTPGERAVAAALDQAQRGKAWKHVVQRDMATARAALGQFSGAIHGAAMTAVIDDSGHVRNAVNDRLRGAFGAAGSAAAPVLAYGPDGTERVAADANRFALWTSAYGGWSSFDGSAGTAALDIESGGALFGGDAPLGDNWRIGLFGGYGKGEYRSATPGSTAEAEGYHLGLYGGGRLGALSLRAGLAHSWLEVETRRGFSLPGVGGAYGAAYDANILQGFAEAGWRIDADPLTFEPFARLAHVHLETKGFRENAGLASLTGRGGTTDTSFGMLGLRTSTTFFLGDTPVELDSTLAWRHAFGDTTPTASPRLDGVPSFEVGGPSFAKNEAVAGAGITVNLSETAALSARYEGRFGKNSHANSISGALKVSF